MAYTKNLTVLEGVQRLQKIREEMEKAQDEREVLIKAVSPSIRKLTYDQVMKSFEVEAEHFSEDAAEFLKDAKASQPVRMLEFIGSTEKQDRDGDRIKVSGWNLNEWKKNPQFLWAHNWAGFPPGTGVKVWKESSPLKALKMWIMFPDDLDSEEAQKFTDMIWAYYSHKPPMLKAVSVGFKPIQVKFAESDEEREKMDLGRYGVLVEKAELWELSGAPIGSNPEALLTGPAKKMFGDKAPSILDAMGYEIPQGKVYISGPDGEWPDLIEDLGSDVDLSAIEGAKALEIDPNPDHSDLVVETTKNTKLGVLLDGIIGKVFDLLVSSSPTEEVDALKKALREQVAMGKTAAKLLEVMEGTDTETQEEHEDPESTERKEDEPSPTESDEEPPDEIPEGAGDDLYLDLIDEDEEDGEGEEPTPSEPDGDDLIEGLATE